MKRKIDNIIFILTILVATTFLIGIALETEKKLNSESTQSEQICKFNIYTGKICFEKERE